MAEAIVNPIILKDEETGKSYTLRFTRRTVMKLEQEGFDASQIEKHPMTSIPEMFYGAFLADQPFIKRETTDKILFEDLGGLSQNMIERLGQLYAAPLNELIAKEDEPKNAKMTVQF